MPVAIDLLPAGVAGLGESPLWDHRSGRLYWVDSIAPEICSSDAEGGDIVRWTLDQPIGSIGAREDLVDCREQGSGPDGATVDAEGRIWAALVLAQAVGCYSPAGKLLRSIPVPLPFPSCPAFGGPDLDTLYLLSLIHI